VIFKPQDESKFVGADEIITDVSLNFGMYQRMLAKIALGAAILKHGPQSFIPLVSRFILGLEDAIDKYVFCPRHEKTGERYGFDTLFPEREIHAIQLRERNVAGCRYLIGFVRLFAFYGAPGNGVVVGILK
jgi:hypothetical protein